jgi:hypothetical protein
VACTWTKNYNPGAVIEWVIAFIFAAYVFSFCIDLYPAAATKDQPHVSPKMRLTRGREKPARGYAMGAEMEEGGSDETTMTAPSGVPSFEAARVAPGRRSGSRSRVLASNF